MSDSLTNDRMEAALESASPFEALMALAKDLKSEGMTRDEIYLLFDHHREVHQDDEDEAKYDAILDTMDFIAGWCSPGNALFEPDT